VIRTAPILLALAATGCLAMANLADAQPGRLYEGISRDPSKAVTYTKIDLSDIDVRSTAGAQALLRRIETAADAVCGGAASRTSKATKADFEDCRDGAISGAVAKMRSPSLNALADRRHRELLAAR
jgi:UrcA family protein